MDMKKVLKQILILIPSVVTLALGISLSVTAGIGSDANASLQSAVSNLTRIPVGTIVFLYNIIILIIFFLMKSRFIGVGSIVMGFFLGPFVNVFTSLLTPIAPSSFFGKLVFCLLGVFFLSLALSWYIPLNYGLQPADMLIQTIADKTKQSYGTGLAIYSILILVLAFLLKGPIGIGTILNALLPGKICDLLIPMFSKLQKKIL